MNLEEVLSVYRSRMITEWVNRLHSGSSERYAQRPLDELGITVSAAYDGSEDVKFLVEMCGTPFSSSLVTLSHAA